MKRERDRLVCILWREADLRAEGHEEQAEVVDCLPPKAMVLSVPGLLPRPMSAIVALLQTQSALMFMPPIITKGQEHGTLQSWAWPLTG